MSDFEPRQLLINTFIRLRQSGIVLGMGELLDALRAVEGGWGTDSPEALRQMAQLLWCKSSEELRELETVWAILVLASSTSVSRPESKLPAPSQSQESISKPSEFPPPQTLEAASVAPRTTPEWGALPIQAPFTPALVEGAPDLHTYWPVSRRFMVYTWRYLRHPIADGPAEILDVKTTVEKVARQGFFLSPVYRRRERNHAHLILLLDQGGSMVPFHRFTRDMIETAQSESTIEQVDVFYFHNIPAESIYLDPYMTSPIISNKVLEYCSNDTSVLVVSDAGAARGHRRLERIRATTEFLSQLKHQTSLIAWLNPMPFERWTGTSAQIIAHLIPMFQMDPDGFSNAIDVIRGQPLSHYR